MKKSITKISIVILSAIFSVMVITSCAKKNVDDPSAVESTQTATKPAQMQEIFNEDWETDVLGEFDTTVALNDREYHITSKALDFKKFYTSQNYEITINGTSVAYNSGEYYHIECAYLADINPDDDSVILFVSPIWENRLRNMTAYKYSSESGIVQLSFDIDGDGVVEPTLEPWRHCDDFKVRDDGTFELITGTNSYGMWGIQRYFRLNENNVLTFEQQEQYEVKGWADGLDKPTTTDRGSTELRIMTYDEVKSHSYMGCGVETEQDYEMLIKGYYSCKQSYGDLNAGDYFRLIYDDNKGNVTFVTSEGREGVINVNTLRDYRERIRIGGFALALAG